MKGEPPVTNPGWNLASPFCQLLYSSNNYSDRKYRRLSQSLSSPRVEEKPGAIEPTKEETEGTAEATQPQKQNLFQLKATWEDELKQLNDTLLSAEEAIKHQASRLEEKKAAKVAASNREGEDSFEFRVKVMPREFLEKQVKRYKEALDNEKNYVEELKKVSYRFASYCRHNLSTFK